MLLSPQKEIAEWLNYALDTGPVVDGEDPPDPPVRVNADSLEMKHLWLYGPTGGGKSTLVKRLINLGVRIYMIPTDEEFYDEYEDDAYDLAVLDEYKAQKRIQWLNRWLDGSQVSLRKKGSQYKKNKPLFTLILSNYVPAECYSNTKEDVIDALERRLTRVYFDPTIHGFVSDFMNPVSNEEQDDNQSQ